MKVWEECWLTEEGDVITSRGEVVLEENPDADKVVREARATLAAAAPAMARILLALEWSAEIPVAYDSYQNGCPSCRSIADKHEPGCALDAALRQAGVR